MNDIVDIKCTYSIPVGEKDGPCPVVYGIAWNPSPPEDSIAMLACASSKGVGIYSLKKNKRKWTSVDIQYRPSSKANFVAWHGEGGVLATTSSSPGGKLSILAYDGEGFTAKTALQAPEGESIESMCWANRNRSLVLALYPSSALCFLRVKDRDPENLENLGLVKFADYFDGTYPIMLTSGSLGGALFAYSRNKLLRFQNSSEHKVAFKLRTTFNVPMGIRAIIFDDSEDGLFTIEDNIWRYWKMDSSNNLTQVAITPKHEKARRQSGEYTSIAISPSGKYLATGGRDNLFCYVKEKDQDIAIEITCQGCRHNVNWGVVTCIDFHPLEDRTKLIALGGDTGYLYVWAVVLSGTMKTKYTEINRQYEFEKKHYSRSFTEADEKDEFVVLDPKYPSIVLKLEDVINAEDTVSESQSDDSDAVGSQSAAGSQSDDADAVGSQSAAATAAPIDPVTADIVGDSSGTTPTLADKLSCVNKGTEQLILERYQHLTDIASQAVSNIMSLGKLADDMLRRRNQLTEDDMTKFLKQVSSAQRNKV